jgi:DHA2 family multidrug resistance protein
MFMPSTPRRPELRFDWTGFLVLALGVGALQLMLDRGPEQDWFSSREIITYTVLSGLGFYLFLVHMLTADRPFLSRGLFLDRNFACSVAMMFCTGMVLLATSALLSPYLQTLADYPVSTAGLALAPRGFGNIAALLLASRLASYIDGRKLMAFGLLLLGWNLQIMSHWTPDISRFELTAALITQGFAMGFFFNPLTVLAFVTLPPELRGEATALQNLARNMGSAIGISVTSTLIVQNTQITHADLAGLITPFNRLLLGAGQVPALLDPLSRHGSALLDQMINRQASIIAYGDDFWLMSFAVIPALVLTFVMRRYRRGDRPSRGPAPVPLPPAAR